MEKVKVNKELFELLENYNLKDETDENFLNAIKRVINGKVFTDERNLVLNGINPRMFLDCIYYGYELEETKEEKINRIYEENKKRIISTKARTQKYYSLGVVEGIRLSKEIYNK